MMYRLKFQNYLLLGILLFLASSCQRDNDLEPIVNNEVISIGDIASLPADVSAPSNNSFSTEKFELGRILFWDPILSGTKEVACATCHHPEFGYADGRNLSSGVNGLGLGPDRLDGDIIKRNAPTILNTGFNGINTNESYDPTSAPMFWDNRASGLEEQALFPIKSHDEMRGNTIAESDIIEIVVERLQAIPTYRNLFELAYGDELINSDRIAQSLATFQRNIIANNSRFDEYLRGDESALSNQERQGMNAFMDAGCADCHSGPMFSDYELHTLSVPDHPLVSDNGATGNFDFRTPTLRNLNSTGPYMHNGTFDNLRDVLEFYDDISGGNGDSQNPNVNDNQIDRDARRLQLNNRQINDILSFLNTLNDDNFDKVIPQSVPSGLPVGGNINA